MLTISFFSLVRTLLKVRRGELLITTLTQTM